MISDSTLSKLSVIAYNQNEDGVAEQVDRLGLKFDRMICRNGTQAVCCYDDDHAVIAFRGTELNRIEDWITDLKCACIRHEFGKVHRGFFAAFANASACVRAFLREHTEKRVVATGHSLGAALAALCIADVVRKPYHPLKVQPLLVTFGSPRVGNYGFSSVISRLTESRRYVNNNDVVPKCPFIGYWHIEGLQYFNRRGDLIKNPNYSYVLYDSLLGRAHEVGRIGLAGIKDHSMLRYSRLIALHETAHAQIDFSSITVPE